MNITTRYIVLALLCAALWMPRQVAGQVRGLPSSDSDTGRYYVHGFDNEWSLDANADRGDAAVRFLLAVNTDDGAHAVVIEATITLDGMPYHEATEKIVDRMLAVAQGESDTSDDEETDESTSTTTQPPAGLPVSMWRRLEHYAKANASSLDRDEARWMVARATGGPALMMLRGDMLPMRLAHSPLWHWLDTNSDGALAAEEIHNAKQRLALLDADRDGTLDQSEWPRTSGDAISLPAAHLDRTGRAKGTIDSDAPLDLDSPLGTDIFLPDVPAKEVVASEALDRADWPEPQLHLTVRLGETDEPRIEIAPIGEADDVNSSGAQVPKNGTLIASDVGETILVEIAGLELYVTVAAGERAGQGATATSHQVSVGVAPVGSMVRDVIDTNRDHRLTPRELRDTAKGLATYDSNDDGRIDADELPRRYRLLFAVGPTAHAILASDVPLPRPASQSPSQPQAPAWFATMDLNRDGDLSASEFLGTADVFETIDSDADGLISAAEAARLDADGSAEPE